MGKCAPPTGWVTGGAWFESHVASTSPSEEHAQLPGGAWFDKPTKGESVSAPPKCGEWHGGASVPRLKELHQCSVWTQQAR